MSETTCKHCGTKVCFDRSVTWIGWYHVEQRISPARCVSKWWSAPTYAEPEISA